jgi:CRP-like cAMP-binding protein
MLTDLPIESLRDRSLLLRSLPAFAQLEDETVSLLAEHARLRRFRAGHVLLSVGEPIHHVYSLLEGSIRWRRKGQEGSSLAAQYQVVGWISLMAREPDGIDAVVEQDAVVVELPADVLELTLEVDFGLVRHLLRLGANRLASLRGELPVTPAQAPPLVLGTRPERRRTLVERLIDMRSVPLFRGSIEGVIALTRRTEDIEVRAGHVFWERGALAPYWVVIEHGHVRCENAAGETVDVGSNFVIGIMDALAQRPRSFSARAQSEVIGNRIDLSAFLGVLETHFDLARDFLAFLSRAVLDGG